MEAASRRSGRTWTLKRILQYFESHKDQDAIAGMARYGIVSRKAYGLSVGNLRELAHLIGTDHRLAQQLWSTGILEGRLLAVLVEDPSRVTPAQMDRWAAQFDNWAICDGCCLHLFHYTPYAWEKADAWSAHKKEFVRRAAFALVAVLAVHDKDASDTQFKKFFPMIRRAAVDERNGVKKAVNWALRQIGKRSIMLNKQAILEARKIQSIDSSSARWIA